jgi:solute carrier family 15 (oligopeptide transporter), member 1
LNEKLLFDKNISTALYHLNEFLLFSFAIFGAIIADSYFGKFRTISAMATIYALGAAVVAIAAVNFDFISARILSFIGLIAMMISSGSVKSCQNAFGGDLFKLPEQTKELDGYFTLQLFSQKFGQVCGMALLPILHLDVKCLGKEDCFPLAFGFAAILMTISLVVFWMGRKSYVHNMPGSNVIVEVISCIFVSS